MPLCFQEFREKEGSHCGKLAGLGICPEATGESANQELLRGLDRVDVHGLLAGIRCACHGDMIAIELLHRVRIVDGPDLFLASSTKTGDIPPSTHFFTHSEPDPACFAPHIESEIQPLMVFESAAFATTALSARTAINIALRFTRNLRERFVSLTALNDALKGIQTTSRFDCYSIGSTT